MSIRFQVADKSRSTGFGKYADGSLKIACNFFSLRFFSHLLRALNEKNVQIADEFIHKCTEKSATGNKIDCFSIVKTKTLNTKQKKRYAVQLLCK